VILWRQQGCGPLGVSCAAIAISPGTIADHFLTGTNLPCVHLTRDSIVGIQRAVPVFHRDPKNVWTPPPTEDPTHPTAQTVPTTKTPPCAPPSRKRRYEERGDADVDDTTATATPSDIVKITTHRNLSNDAMGVKPPANVPTAHTLFLGTTQCSVSPLQYISLS
jgi:hypothetical protein